MDDVEAPGRVRRRSVEGGSRRASMERDGAGTEAQCTVLDYNRETALVVKHATPYVSKRVRQFILRRQGSGGSFQPEAASCSAYVLIADISGYTRLTTHLTEQIDGGHGAFALNVAVNRIFGGITTMIEAFGGDVVKYVGDAVIAAWYLEHSSDENAAQAAAHAAASAAMLMISQPLISPAPGHSMSLHCALAFGVLSELVLGGVDNRWQHLISGSIFDELKHILGAAGPGQMCVSEEVWHRLERCDGVATRVEGASCGDGSGVFRVEKIRYHELSKVEKWVASVEMPLPQEIEQQVMQFLPHPPQEALRTGTEMWLAENRWVACVFFNFRMLEAEHFATAQEVMSSLMGLIGKHDGDLHQLVCDEKGTTAIGLWGTPPHSHPDDPIFAARCAVDVARLTAPILEAAGLGTIRAGISVGRAFCGNIGSVSRCEFCLVGDVMNMAARLAGAAGKLDEAVLCDEHCAQFIADAGDRSLVAELRTHDLTLKNVDRVVVASVLGGAQPQAPGAMRSFSRMRWAMASTRSIGGASVGDLQSLDEDGPAAAGSAGGGGGSMASARISGSARGGAASAFGGGAGPDPSDLLRPDRTSAASESSPHFGGIFGMDTFRNRSPVLFGREEALREVVRLVDEANAGPNGGGRLLITVTGAMSMGKTSFLKVAALAVVKHCPEQCCLFLNPGRAGTDTETPFHSWRVGWFQQMCERHAPFVPERLRRFLPLLDDVFRTRQTSTSGGGGSSNFMATLRDAAHGTRGASGFSDAGNSTGGDAGVAPSGNSLSGADAVPPHVRRSTADGSAVSVDDSATAGPGNSNRGAGSVASDSAEWLRSLPAEDRVRWTIALATEIVAMEADMADLPLVIIADDAHFMDAVSWKLLLSVQAAIRPSIILSFWRQEIPALRHLKANSSMNRRCRLGPLGPDDLKKLVAYTLGVPEEAVAGPVVSVIVSMSAGHPMLAKEITVMLVREGKLQADAAAGTCELVGGKEDIEKGALAPGQNAIARMQMLVQHRLDGFGMAARSALRVAAAIRGKFDLAFLRRCCVEVTSEAEAQSIASELLEEGVWVMIPETPVHYQFAHDLVRSLVYQSIPPDQRRQIHAAILYDLEHSQELLHGDAGTQRLAEKARHAREAHEHVKATSYYLECARAGASFLSHGRWGLNDALKSAREGLKTLNLAQQPGPGGPRQSVYGATDEHLNRAMSGVNVSNTGESDSTAEADGGDTPGEKSERVPPQPSGGGAGSAGASWTEPPSQQQQQQQAKLASRGSNRAVQITDDSPTGVAGGSSRRAFRTIRRAGSRQAASSIGGPVSEHGASDDDGTEGRNEEGEEFFDESTVYADVAVLQSELQAVLDSVERVQTSWAVLEKNRPKHGLVMMKRFFEIAPQSLHLFSFYNDSKEDPDWCIEKDKRVASHAVIIISTVGAVVAGLKDFQTMAQTIRKVGLMHHRHKGAREFFTPMGQALLHAVQQALGDGFTPDVGEAWMSVYDVVKLHMLSAMDEAEAQERERASLKASLLGDLGIDL